jgi:hypothetical protein
MEYPLMVPSDFEPAAVLTSRYSGYLVEPPQLHNAGYPASPIDFACYDRANPQRRVILAQAEPGGLGVIAQLLNPTKISKVTIGGIPGELQIAPGIYANEPVIFQLIRGDCDHSYILLATGYSEDEFLQLAATLRPVH